MSEKPVASSVYADNTSGPILLGLPIQRQSSTGEKSHEASLNTEDLSWKQLPPHKDEGQVQLDVDRAFVYYPDCK